MPYETLWLDKEVAIPFKWGQVSYREELQPNLPHIRGSQSLLNEVKFPTFWQAQDILDTTRRNPF